MALNRPKDKLKIKFNAIEGKFDLVQEFNADRIVTHQLNAFANPFTMWDAVRNEYFQIEDQIVTDSDGNIVVV